MVRSIEVTLEVIRIVIADDHALFRGALRKLLESQPDLMVAGEASSAWEAEEQLRMLKPDVLLLDLDMPQQSGMEVLRRIRGDGLATRTVLLTAAIKNDEIVEALRLGARGVMLKDSASGMLYKCIRAVMAGEHWIDHEGVSLLVNKIRSAPEPGREPGQPGMFGLTARELEILATVTNGYTNKDIAEKFHISEQTVKHHLTNVFEKVGVTNRLELALMAMNSELR